MLRLSESSFSETTSLTTEKEISCRKKYCTSKCIIVFLVISNICAIGGLSFNFITMLLKDSTPLPVPIPPVYNGSCPFNNVTSNGEFKIAVLSVSTIDVTICWPKIAYSAWNIGPYVVSTDDFYSGREELWPIYTGNKNEINITDVLPGSTIRIQATSLNASDDIVTSNITAVKVQDFGGCGNAGDLGVFKNVEENDMPAIVQSCLIGNPFSRDRRIACIQNALPLTYDCSGCWADEYGCIIENCAFRCLPPSNPDCEVCLNTICVPIVARCAGLPMWAFGVGEVVQA